MKDDFQMPSEVLQGADTISITAAQQGQFYIAVDGVTVDVTDISLAVGPLQLQVFAIIPGTTLFTASIAKALKGTDFDFPLGMPHTNGNGDRLRGLTATIVDNGAGTVHANLTLRYHLRRFN